MGKLFCIPSLLHKHMNIWKHVLEGISTLEFILATFEDTFTHWTLKTVINACSCWIEIIDFWLIIILFLLQRYIKTIFFESSTMDYIIYLSESSLSTIFLVLFFFDLIIWWLSRTRINGNGLPYIELLRIKSAEVMVSLCLTCLKTLSPWESI